MILIGVFMQKFGVKMGIRKYYQLIVSLIQMLLMKSIMNLTLNTFAS